jgi:hypothetical protein
MILLTILNFFYITQPLLNEKMKNSGNIISYVKN